MTDDPRLQFVREALRESARVKTQLLSESHRLTAIAERMVASFRLGGRVYACGNGGSACDAMHLVEELVARYKRDRPGLPAHHLLDAATLTCWSNDYDFESAFSRQVETMMKAEDVLVAISTSGNSPNVIRAVEAATRVGAWTLGLTGGDGGLLRATCSEALVVPSSETARIQEGHITILHILCELIEDIMFPRAPDAATLPDR